MTRYLLDTNVISAVAPNKGAQPALRAWLSAHGDSLFMSSVSVAEIESGISKLHRIGAKRRAADLADWLDRLLDAYGERVLSLDIAAARLAGAISDRAQAQGRHPGFADVAIAAIADANGLIILTGNTRDFALLGVALLDPFSERLPA